MAKPRQDSPIRGQPRMDLQSNDELELNLESAVVSALTKLQKKKRGAKSRTVGVSRKNIVKFLKANCSWLDGDVDSQVMTALLSCVKTGVVCALDGGNFRLVNPTSKNMISNCVNRVSHGPKCSCLTTLRELISYRRPCCVVKGSVPAEAKAGRKGKKPSAGEKCGGRKRRKTQRKQKAPEKCAKTAQCSLGVSFSDCVEAEQEKQKCRYCQEVHFMPKSRRLYSKCRSFGTFAGVPADKFSPRDESSDDHTPFTAYK